MTTICVLHPGAMGVSIGAAARVAGHDAIWVPADRSPETHARAEAAGLRPAVDIGDALDRAEVVISVCPPAAAIDVAARVASTKYDGVYLDANAIAPATARVVGTTVSDAGATAIDGGIVGPPANLPGTTRLFVSGKNASVAESWFAGSNLEVVVVPGDIGAASATKVAYAAWTKTSSALLLAVAAYAEAEGAIAPLVEEWQRSQPGLVDRLAHTAAGVAPKAWRFAGELADSASAFADAGLPSGFGEGAADLYQRLAEFRDMHGLELDEVIGAILGDR